MIVSSTAKTLSDEKLFTTERDGRRKTGVCHVMAGGRP